MICQYDEKNATLSQNICQFLPNAQKYIYENMPRFCPDFVPGWVIVRVLGLFPGFADKG